MGFPKAWTLLWPLHAVNFSVSSVGLDLAHLIHCVEVLWAVRLMKHIMMQAHQSGAWECRAGWMWQKKAICRWFMNGPLGCFCSQTFLGREMGVSVHGSGCCVFLDLGLHLWEVNGVKPSVWISLCLPMKTCSWSTYDKSCPFFLNPHVGSLWGMIYKPCPMKGLTSSQNLGVVNGNRPKQISLWVWPLIKLRLWMVKL